MFILIMLMISVSLVMFHITQLAERCSLYMILQRELEPGEHSAGWGKCYICGKMTPVEIVDDKYRPRFVLDIDGNKLFVGSDCYSSDLKEDLERVPV